MKILKKIITSVMNWIRVFQIFLFPGGLILLLLSWKYKSFPFLLSVSIIFNVLIASLIPKYLPIFIPLTTVSIILVLAEIVLLFILPNSEDLGQYDRTSGYASGSYYERIPGFGYRPNPGVYTSRKITSNGEVIYDVVYTIGKDGYRDDVQSSDYKAYIYGGSFTFGEGLNDNETLSFYLFQNHGISSKNVGVHGYGLHQALYNIEQRLVPQKEKVTNVLLTSPWHALRSSCKPWYSAGTPRYKITTTKKLQLVGVCGKHSVLKKVLKKSNVLSLINLVFQFDDENIITDYDMDLYIEIIKEIAHLSRANDSKLLIAYINYADAKLSNTRWNNASIISELSNFSTVVDVTLAEKNEELDSRFYIHKLDMHPSAIANEYRAKLISSYLKN